MSVHREPGPKPPIRLHRLVDWLAEDDDKDKEVTTLKTIAEFLECHTYLTADDLLVLKDDSDIPIVTPYELRVILHQQL